jgi:hypothetical protein
MKTLKLGGLVGKFGNTHRPAGWRASRALFSFVTFLLAKKEK